MSKATWSKDVVTWREQGCLCLSIPFTWLLPKARGIALSHPNERVVAGGPAVRLMPDYVAEWAEVETIVPETWPLQRHNPEATRTTLGCPNSCPFCGVRRIEPAWAVLDEWPDGSVVCDNNLLAAPLDHIERVMESLRGKKNVDFQGGVDPQRLTFARANLLAEANPQFVRTAWDTRDEEQVVWSAVALLEQAGIPRSRITIYCLVNFGEEVAEALDRLETCRARGCLGFAMRYQSLDALKKNAYVHPNWRPRELLDFCRYWNRQAWLGGKVTYQEWRSRDLRKQEALAL